jgi:hypothetical protein
VTAKPLVVRVVEPRRIRVKEANDKNIIVHQKGQNKKLHYSNSISV